MRSIILNGMIAYSCVCTPILLGVALLTFLRPIKTARTITQRTLYILVVVFFPLLLPLILVIISASLLIQPVFLLIVVLIVPLAGVFLLLIYSILPRVVDFIRRLAGGLAKRIFSFIMNLPTYPLERVDASIDTLASSSWRILARNPINKLIPRRETKWVMGWWGRKDGRVSYLLALARDPGLEISKRKIAITELGRIASAERLQNLAPENDPLDEPQTATSIRLRELACDRAVDFPARFMAATTLLNHSFRGEARQAFWDLADDPKTIDPLIRVQIAQGLSKLGPESRSQAMNILIAILADNLVPFSVRWDAAKIVAPLCDNLVDARKMDGILKQWSKNTSPQVRLQAARILALLFQRHQNNPSGMAQELQWEQRAIKIAAGLVTLPYTSSSSSFSIQALQVLGKMGVIDRLIDFGNNQNLFYPIRSEAARELERLGQVDEAAAIWMDIGKQTDSSLIVSPSQRIESVASAGQIMDDNWREIREILQSIAQATCISKPKICLEAASALRQLGWYEEAMSFVMVLDKNHRGKPELARSIGEAMRWRDL